MQLNVMLVTFWPISYPERGANNARLTNSILTQPNLIKMSIDFASQAFHIVLHPVNSKLDWNDNLAAVFDAKLTFNRPSSSVPFYCICLRG